MNHHTWIKKKANAKGSADLILVTLLAVILTVFLIWWVWDGDLEQLFSSKALSLVSDAQHPKQNLLESGQKQLSLGDLDKARRAFQQLVGLEENADGYYFLGTISETEGRFAEAADYYRFALALDPQHKGSLFKNIRLALAEDHLKQAENGLLRLQKMVTEAGEKISIQVLEAALMIRQGNLHRARKILDTILTLNPAFAEAIILKIALNKKEKKLEKQRYWLKRAEKYGWRNDVLSIYLAYHFMALGKENRAYEILTKQRDKKVNSHPMTPFYPRFSSARALSRLYSKKPRKMERLWQSMAKENAQNSYFLRQWITSLSQIYASQTKQKQIEIKKMVASLSERFSDDLYFQLTTAAFYWQNGERSLGKKNLQKLDEVSVADFRSLLTLAEWTTKRMSKNQSLGILQRLWMRFSPEKKQRLKAAWMLFLRWSPRKDPAIMQLSSLLKVTLKKRKMAFSSPEETLKKARRFVQEGSDAQAIKLLITVPKSFKPSVAWLKLLATAQMNVGDSDGAKITLLKAQSLNPQDERITLQYASTQALTGNWLKAEKLYERLTYSDKTGVQLVLSQLKALNGGWLLANQSARMFYKHHDPNHPWGYTLAGLASVMRGHVEMAFEHFKKAHILHRGAVEPVLYDVKVRAIHQGWQAAAARLKTIVSASPEHFFAWNLLGEVHAKLGQASAAAEAFQKAFQLHPEWITPLINQGALLMVLKDYRAAEKVFAAAAKEQPEDPWSLFFQSLALLKQGKMKEALTVTQAVLRRDPRFDPAANNLAFLWLTVPPDPKQAGDKAFFWAKRFANSHQSHYLDTLGTALFRQKKVRASLNVLERAVVVAPKNAEIRCRLGRMHFKEGNRASAKVHLTRCVDAPGSFPGKEAAKRALKRMGVN
ncbi:tetratricopeptide repeat protein [Magnetococcales bacterium HHB-1]